MYSESELEIITSNLDGNNKSTAICFKSRVWFSVALIDLINLHQLKHLTECLKKKKIKRRETKSQFKCLKKNINAFVLFFIIALMCVHV